VAAHVHRLAAPCAYAAGSDRKVKVFTLFSGGFPPPARVGIAPVYTSVPPLSAGLGRTLCGAGGDPGLAAWVATLEQRSIASLLITCCASPLRITHREPAIRPDRPPTRLPVMGRSGVEPLRAGCLWVVGGRA